MTTSFLYWHSVTNSIFAKQPSVCMCVCLQGRPGNTNRWRAHHSCWLTTTKGKDGTNCILIITEANVCVCLTIRRTDVWDHSAVLCGCSVIDRLPPNVGYLTALAKKGFDGEGTSAPLSIKVCASLITSCWKNNQRECGDYTVTCFSDYSCVASCFAASPPSLFNDIESLCRCWQLTTSRSAQAFHSAVSVFIRIFLCTFSWTC